MASADEKTANASSQKEAPSQGRLGLTLRPLQPDEKQQNGLDSGLLVQQARGPAALAGVQAGDVLVSISPSPSPSSFLPVLEGAEFFEPTR